MPKFKVLRSVAHNIGHSFTSLMNFDSDSRDYVMGRILRNARRTGLDTLRIDFVTGEAGPTQLVAKPLSSVPKQHIEFFWYLVKQQGSDRAYVKAANLTLRYDLSVQLPVYADAKDLKSPYVCDVRITDIRGREYAAHFEGSWFPEPIPVYAGPFYTRWWNSLKWRLVRLATRFRP